MKQLPFCFALVATASFSSKAETTRFVALKETLRDHGYNIAADYYSEISQGNSFTQGLTFNDNTEYIIAAVSDDDNVTDMDLVINNDSGDVETEDREHGAIAVVTFTPSTATSKTVKITNHASNAPLWNSKCRFVVGARTICGGPRLY